MDINTGTRLARHLVLEQANKKGGFDAHSGDIWFSPDTGQPVQVYVDGKWVMCAAPVKCVIAPNPDMVFSDEVKEKTDEERYDYAMELLNEHT